MYRSMSVATGVVMALLCARAHAVGVSSCTASASGVAFGVYDPTSATALSGMGTVTSSCTGVGALASWTVALSSGVNSSGSFSPRKMKAVRTMSYNLYTDAAHTTIWGDGTAGTTLPSQSVAAFVGTVAFPLTVYGLITPNQDLPAGSYSDTITVTITY